MEILTFPKLLKPRMPILKSAPHTTLAQKYGNNNLTTINCDIWSMGCVIYEICTFKPPFRTNGTIRDLGAKIIKGKY